MTGYFLYSPRLLFVAATPDLLRAELRSTAALAQLLNVTIPLDWPPGEYDQEAMRFFLQALEAGGPTAIGHYSYYIIMYPTKATPATLVASGGYLGPGDETGRVEIGYAVSGPWRRQGIATEVVHTLVEQAWRQERTQRVVAHTDPANQASIRVLTKNGFVLAKSRTENQLCFECFPSYTSG